MFMTSHWCSAHNCFKGGPLLTCREIEHHYFLHVFLVYGFLFERYVVLPLVVFSLFSVMKFPFSIKNSFTFMLCPCVRVEIAFI